MDVSHNTWRQRQNIRHFADDIFKLIFLNENCCILIQISLKFVLRVQINSIPALVQTMAWHQTGDKPLSEPMMAYRSFHSFSIRKRRPLAVVPVVPFSFIVAYLGDMAYGNKMQRIQGRWRSAVSSCEFLSLILSDDISSAKTSTHWSLNKMAD